MGSGKITLGQVGKALAKVKGRMVAAFKTKKNQTIVAMGPSSDSDEPSSEEFQLKDNFVLFPAGDSETPSETSLDAKGVAREMHRANFRRQEIDDAVDGALSSEEIEEASLEAQAKEFVVEEEDVKFYRNNADTVSLSDDDFAEDIKKAIGRPGRLEVSADIEDDFDAEMSEYNAEGEPPAFDPHGEPEHPGGEPNDPNGNTESSTEKRGLK